LGIAHLSVEFDKVDCWRGGGGGGHRGETAGRGRRGADRLGSAGL